MHAITYSNPGGPDVLQWAETPTPQPKADEVLIKVAAAGGNRADVMQRQGKYPPPPGASDILGLEAAGEIVAKGDKVARWKIGDKVCALLAGGGYAEYAAVPEGQCLPVPPNLSMTQAAGLPETVITVWANLFESGNLKPNEIVLVHGGSSGIGSTALQMAKCAGAKAFVTVGSEEKAAACRTLGADLVINYNKEDFVTVIERETSGRGVNVVLDIIGGDYVPRNLTVLAPYGRHISVATQQGKNATIDMRLVMRKRLMLTGSTLRDRPAEEKARLVREVEKNVWPWVVSGRLKPLIYKVYPIKNAAEAHKVMESGAHIGKMALEVAS